MKQTESPLKYAEVGSTCGAPDDVWPIDKRYALFTAVIIFFIGMFDLVDRQVIASLFPHLKEEFALSDKQLGMLVSAVNISISVLVVPSAYLVDHWSRKKMIFLMGTIWSVSTLLCGFVTGFTHLLMARLLCGFGEAGYQPAGQSLLSACFPRKYRATATAIVTCGMSLGAPVGLMIGAFVSEHWGWRHAFGVVAIPGLLLSFLALRMHDFKVVAAEAPKKKGFWAQRGDYLATLREIVKMPTVLCVICSAVCIRMFNGVLLSWTPTYFTRVAEVPMTVASTYASLIIVAESLAIFLGGPVVDWVKSRSNRLVPIWLCFAMLASGALYVAAYKFCQPGSLVQVAVLVTSSLIFGTVFSAGTFLIVDLTAANYRATAISLMILSQNLLGYSVGPIVTGTISDMFNLSTAMVMSSFVLLAGAIFYGICIFSYPRDKENAACVDIEFH